MWTPSVINYLFEVLLPKGIKAKGGREGLLKQLYPKGGGIDRGAVMKSKKKRG